LAYITQTTLSVDDTKEIIEALHKKYTNLQGPALNDICYATQNRQDAVKKMLQDIDLLLVIGSKNSSNSNRLKDLGLSFGITSYLIDNEDDIDLSWFENKKAIGITAGASAPEVLLSQVLNFLDQYFILKIDGLEKIDENIRFRVPIKLEVSQ
jgi:4-hydroxy-3-methylbut-2-enyl diphosphate reductase